MSRTQTAVIRVSSIHRWEPGGEALPDPALGQGNSDTGGVVTKRRLEDHQPGAAMVSAAGAGMPALRAAGISANPRSSCQQLEGSQHHASSDGFTS